jgi:hypothetical protein
MIVIDEVISRTVADDARASLGKQIRQLRAKGKLEAGQDTTHEVLRWTTETYRAAHGFEEVYFTQSRNLRDNTG